MKKHLKILLILLTLVGYAYAKPTANVQVEKIKKAVAKQVACWNTGNLDCFMDGYFRNDKILFIAGTKFMYGWQTAYDYYSKKYGNNKSSMGELRIDIEGVDILGSKSAFAYGRWHLTVNGRSNDGVTSLVLQRENNKWKILRDHSN